MISRLIGMVETGLMEINDPALAERLKTLKTKRAGLQNQIGTASAIEPAQNTARPRPSSLNFPPPSAALRNAPADMRKAYLKLFWTTS